MNELKVYDRAIDDDKVNALWFKYYHDLHLNDNSLPTPTPIENPSEWLKDYTFFDNSAGIAAQNQIIEATNVDLRKAQEALNSLGLKEECLRNRIRNSYRHRNISHHTIVL